MVVHLYDYLSGKRSGNPGALLEEMIDVLPTVAAEVAAPLEKAEKLVFISRR